MYVTRFSSIPSCRISEIDFSLKNVAKIQSIIKDVHISEQSYSKYSSQHAAQSRLESETELSASVYQCLPRPNIFVHDEQAQPSPAWRR